MKMVLLKQLMVLLLSMCTFVYTLYVVGLLMEFLSLPKSVPTTYTWLFNLLDNRSRLETAFGPIVFNTLYMILFIIQHSFMKSDWVKKILQTIGLSVAERSIYCLTSSICLHALLKNWSLAPSIVLWQVDVENSNVLWWTFMLIHAFAWMVIYGGSFIMDIPELLGVKQAYYDIKGYVHPIFHKSFELRRLYAHVRHPSLTALSIILWASNCMSVDRLLLSTMLTAYMYFAWSTNRNDFIHQRYQLKRISNEVRSR